MTLNDFIKKWAGEKADWDGAYAGQCVDLFRYYCHEVLGIKQPDGVWGAANFWTEYDTDNILKENFDRVPNNADFAPEKGDVMVWNFKAGGGFGHIGVCTGENDGLRYFKSFDQNWSRISFCEIVNHSYTNVYGVLRPKDKSMQITPEERDHLISRATVAKETAIYLEIKGDPDLVSFDEIKKVISGFKGRITDLEKQTGVAWANLAKAEDTISTLVSQLLSKDTTIKERDTSIKTANTRILALEGEVEGKIEEKGEVATELAECKAKRDYTILLRIRDYIIARYK